MKEVNDNSAFSQYDREYVAHFRGGATFVLAEILVAAEIEERAEKHIQGFLNNHEQINLRDLFPGGFIASSAGVFPTFAAAASSPSDPNRPRYRMRDFAEVFSDHLPEFLPKEQGVVMRNWAFSGLDTAKEMNEKLYNFLTSKVVLKTGAFLANVLGGRAHKKFVVGTLSEAFKAIAAHRNDPSRFTTDKNAMLAVLQEEVGLETTLGDMNTNIIVTAQRAYITPDEKINHYFINIKPEEMTLAAQDDNMSPAPDTKVVDVIQSTIAVPFVSNPHNGLQDGGGMTNGTEILAYMSKALKNGDKLGYVSFDNISRSMFVNETSFGIMREVANMEAILVQSAKESHETAIRHTLGEHSYFMEIPFSFEDKGDTVKFSGNATNMLDTSAEQMEAIKQHANAWISANDAMLNQLSLNLARGYIARKERHLMAAHDSIVHRRDKIQLAAQ